MIRVIRRCLGNKKLEEHKWDYHLACFHFKNYKNCYLNGKPLKPYHILRNGDIVDIVERPKGIIEGIIGIIAISIKIAADYAVLFAISHPIIAGIIGVTALSGLGAGAMAIAGGGARPTTTQNKEYSSSTQPELRGASNDISDGILPVMFGKTQQTPSYGQLPYRLVADGSSTNKYRQYFTPNYNNVVYSDFKLGDTPVENYSIDYLDIITASGVNNFIGFDNVKVASIDEELSYNAEEEVNQSAIYYYNEPDTITSITVNYVLRFSNVDYDNFSDKEFQSIIRVSRNGVTDDLTSDVTITKSNLTQVDANTYTYSGTVVHGSLSGVTELVYVQYSPVSNTRNNDAETTNELDSLYVSQEVITDNLELNTTVNESINKYAGTVSEVCSTSPENTKDIDVIISFPQGLYKVKNDGSRERRNTVIEITYKTQGGAYQPISNADALYVRDINGNKLPLTSTNTTVNGSKVTVYSPNDMNIADQLFYRVIGFTLPKDKYTVRVRSADFSAKTNFDIGFPQCSEIQYYVDGDVLDENILPRVNQISFEAIAYKGLSGTLKKFNYVAEARIPVWNGTDWNTIAPTQNPAAIVRYLLTSPDASPRPIPKELIDNDSLVEYYNWCETQGYKASGVVSDEVKTQDVINEILSNSQGAMIPLLNGKHTFAIDGHNDKTPKGLFNQHNSWDFVWSPSVGRLTEAIRASFINNEDYTTDEVTVYWYDGAVHTEIKPNTTDDDYLIVKKDLKYINDKDSVIKSISYELETIQTRRNNFEFKVNLEALNMTLLDRFYITNSANMQNEKTGLIKEVLTKDGNIIGFRLYSMIDIPQNSQIIIRSLDYVNETPIVNIFDVTNGGKSADKVFINPIPYNNQIRGAGEIKGLQDKWHYDGDLFAIGQGTIYDCVITDVKYNEDNTATITAREY